MVSGNTFGRVCHFEKTALILPIRVIYFHFKVHATVAYCSILVFATADMFLEMVELSKLYLAFPLDTCLVQLLPQEYVLSLILDRERGTPKPSKMPRLGAEEVDMKKALKSIQQLVGSAKDSKVRSSDSYKSL
jgi:hypothetical protein